MNFVIVHYSEIGLKKGNRNFFESALIANIKRVLPPPLFLTVKKISGRLLINLTEEGIKNEEVVKKVLGSIFGIAHFLFCLKILPEITALKKETITLLSEQKFKTFRIRVKRSEKSFPLTSLKLNQEIGEAVLGSLKGIKVDLENPEITCWIEIVGQDVFLSIKKNRGLGGLPTGTGGYALSLLSGGIDSPVASFLAMSRGVKIIFLHFHSYPETSAGSIDKVRRLVKVLARYQGQSRLLLVPFAQAQRDIFLNISSALRVIFYRRLMLKIAEKIVKKEKVAGIITGESLGQVASQTIENIRAIQKGSRETLIRPLICQDKESIIQIARRIGTFEISILPQEDCCSRFLPRHPETKAEIERMLEEEKKLNLKKIIDRAIKSLSIEKIDGN